MHTGTCHGRRTCWRAACRGSSLPVTCAPEASNVLLRRWARDRSAYSSCIGCCANSPRPGISLRLSRSEEHTSELQSQSNLVCRLLLEKNKFSLAHALGHTIEIEKLFCGHDCNGSQPSRS